MLPNADLLNLKSLATFFLLPALVPCKVYKKYSCKTTTKLLTHSSMIYKIVTSYSLGNSCIGHTRRENAH